MARSVPARTFTGWEQLDDPVEEEVLISLYGFAHTASNGPQAPQVTTVTRPYSIWKVPWPQFASA